MINGLISHTKHKKGFTVIELLVVIAVIGVLATIVVVGYGTWKKSILASQVQSDLNGAISAMENAKNFNNGYPGALPSTIAPSNGVSFNLQSISSTQYCIDATTSGDASIKYYIASEIKDKGAQSGTCATDRAGASTLAAPTGLGVLSYTATTVNLTWTASPGASAYTLQCATDSAYITGAQTQVVNSPATTGTVTGLQAVSTHYCRIKATNATADSGYSGNAKADTTTYLPPTGVAVSGNTNTTFVVSWAANVDASGYTVQCAKDNLYTTGLKTSSTSGLSKTITSLTPNTTYYCHVNATNTTGTPSAFGTTVTTATTANFGTIAVATGLTEVSPGPASGSFSWTGITCSLGTAQYSLVWVSPQTTSTAWSAATTVSASYPQQTLNTWKVQSRCIYSPLTSSTTTSINESFTSVGTDDPSGAFGTIGWDGRWTFNVNANTFVCTSPAVLQFQLIATKFNTTSGTWSYGWTTSLSSTATSVNQGSQMTTFFQVRCLLNSISSNVPTSSPRTDNASIDAPGSVPGWSHVGSPKGERWSAVGCPAGTTASYWAYAVGDYSNAIWGAYEATGFYGYDRASYSYGNTMVNSYLKARCLSSYTASGYGPQGYARY